MKTHDFWPPNPEPFQLSHATCLRITDTFLPLPVSDLAKDVWPLNSGHCDMNRGLGSGVIFLPLRERHRMRNSLYFFPGCNCIWCLLIISPSTLPRAWGQHQADKGRAKRSRVEPWVPLTWSHPTLELLDLWDNPFPYYRVSQPGSGFPLLYLKSSSQKQYGKLYDTWAWGRASWVWIPSSTLQTRNAT